MSPKTREGLTQSRNDLLRRLERTNRKLDRLDTAECPKPHNPVQHRDGRQPWCNACGRGRDHTQVHSPRLAPAQVT